ncbi:hypothetical protein [Aquimonas sp.]|uniref:hypothetical protein n=1 Tax=Aquimonas sp. TaxID=1872588 RepID=UPI0037BF9E1B
MLSAAAIQHVRLGALVAPSLTARSSWRPFKALLLWMPVTDQTKPRPDANAYADSAAALLAEHAPGTYRIRPLLEALIVFVALMLATFITVGFIYQRALVAQKQEIRQGLLRTANVLSTLVDADLHRRFDSAEQESAPEFIAQEQMLIRARKADPQIAFLYTAVLKGDAVLFVLDATPQPAEGEDDTRVALLEPYPDPPAEIVTALREQTTTASDEPYTDEWGTFVSAYVPLLDEAGQFYAVLGLDLDVSDYLDRLEPIERATQRALVTAFFIAFLTAAAVWFLRRFILELHRRRNALYADLRRLGRASGDGADT